MKTGDKILNEKCEFYSPAGKKLFYNVTDVANVFYDADPTTPISGIQGMASGDDNNLCGLKIPKISQVSIS